VAELLAAPYILLLCYYIFFSQHLMSKLAKRPLPHVGTQTEV